MTSCKAILPVLVAAGLSMAVIPALAQTQGRTALDPNGPVDLAYQGDGGFKPATCSWEVKGNVRVTQGGIRLIAQTMAVRSPRRGDGCASGIVRVEADNDVYYVTPNESVRADHAVYDLPKDIVTFTGGVILLRGENVATAERVVINVKTNETTMDGGTRAVLYPERNAQ